MNSQFAIFAGLIVVTTLAVGCVTPIQSQAIVPATRPATRSFPGSVAVTVTGNINTPNTKLLEAATFRTALLEGIRRSQLFRSGLVDSGGDYQLDVNVLSIEWPGPGLAMKTTFTSRWKLMRKDSGDVVCDEIIRTVHIAPLSEAFDGVARAKRSVEGAASGVIADGLKALDKHVAQ